VHDSEDTGAEEHDSAAAGSRKHHRKLSSVTKAVGTLLRRRGSRAGSTETAALQQQAGDAPGDAPPQSPQSSVASVDSNNTAASAAAGVGSSSDAPAPGSLLRKFSLRGLAKSGPSS
jgi:hypothetical protein